MNNIELKTYTSKNLESIECMGINPYKQVELWKNYRIHVDPEFWDDVLYLKLGDKVMAINRRYLK